VDETSVRFEGWRVAAASGIGVLLASGFVYSFAIFLKPLSEEFVWSRQAIASAYGFAAMASAASAPLVGYLFDRIAPRRIILPSLILLGSGFASLSALTGLWQLYATFALLGLAGTALSPLAYGRAISSWFEIRRGVALGVMVAGGGIGGLLHPPLAQTLTGLVGWRGTYLVLGGLTTILGIAIVLPFVRERPSSVATSAGNSPGSPGLPVREGLKTRAFWTLAVVLFGSSLAQSGTIVHLVALLADRGIPADRGALALSAMGAAALGGRIVTGWMLDRFFVARVSSALLALAAAGTFLLSGAHSWTVGVVAAVLVGFGVGGEGDVAPYLLSRYFGLRSFSTLYGIAYTVIAVAGAAGPVLMGNAFDSTGTYGPFLVKLSAGMLAVALVMLTLPRPASQPASSVA